MPTIQNRRATAAQWTAANPVLAAGEIGFELDTNALKVGDGLTLWETLPYLSDESLKTLVESGRLSEAVLNDTYALAVQVVADGTDQTAEINTALAAPTTPGDRKTVKLVGDFTITAPLVIHSNTRLDATDATITKTNNASFKMLHNAAMYGTGERDHDMTVVGGSWLRPVAAEGATPGAEPNDAHSILFHRADRVKVTDLRFVGDGSIKYFVYGVDVTHFTAERLDITSTSDGVHVTGPSQHITIRDIVGTVHDDLVSFTGRDYDNWELTPGGGDLFDILVERVHIREGDGNAVKLLPGAGKTLTDATVRNISGTTASSIVTLYSDDVLPSTTGGTLVNILIDGVTGNPAQGYLVNVRHGDVQGLKIRNLDVSLVGMARAVSFNVAGTIRNAVIDGITSKVLYPGILVHVGPGVTVESLQVSNVSVSGQVDPSPLGSVVTIEGIVHSLQMLNIREDGGKSAVWLTGAGECRNLSILGWHTTAQLGVYLGTATAIQMQLANVTGAVDNGSDTLLTAGVSGSSITLRGSGLTRVAADHLGRAVPGATLRATGAEVRVNAGNLTPQAGDIVYNTNATLPCGVGVVVWTGASWANLALAPPVYMTRGWDLPSIAAGGSTEVSATFPAESAVAMGDFVRATPTDAFPAGLVWSAWVSAANTVTLRVANMTAAEINPPSGTWRLAVSKT